MIRENCTTAICNILQQGGLIKSGDDANGAMSGLAHLPSELQEALESGSLSDRVGAVVVFGVGVSSSSISISMSPSLRADLFGPFDELAAGFGSSSFIEGVQLPVGATR
jgi:hypothetical protein